MIASFVIPEAFAAEPPPEAASLEKVFKTSRQDNRFHFGDLALALRVMHELTRRER
jgi:hypothetical protein